MQGIRNIILGLILAAVSGAIIAAADLGGSYLAYVVWFLLACGVILVAGGLYQSVTPGSDGINAEELYKSDAIAKLMLQSTLSTALADGELNDNEITAIVAACESVAKGQLGKQSIGRLAQLIDNRGEAILDEIHSEGRMLNLDARTEVVDACVQVAGADGHIDVRETAAMTAIARRLDFSEDEAQAMIAEAIRRAETG